MRTMHKAMPSKLTRQLRSRMLIGYFSGVVIWTLFGLFTMSGILSLLYFATIAVIFIPTIIYVLKLPMDDHVA
jgi:O-antigen ligase